MIDGFENKHFDISRRNGVSFRHYQILVKLFRNDKTEHHSLDVFTSGPSQLLEMRRVFTKIYCPQARALFNSIKNN